MTTIGEINNKCCKMANFDSMRYNVKQLFKKGLPKGLSTGWLAFDEYFTLLRGQLNVLTGFPGDGKSTWMEALACNMAIKDDWNIFLFSPECYPIEYHMVKLAEKIKRIPVKTKYGEGEMTEVDFDEALELIENRFSFVDASLDDFGLDDILCTIEHSKQMLGKSFDMAIIDPWNELEGHRPPNVTETDFIGESLKKIRKFARKHDISFWVVAHPAKTKNKDGSKPDLSLYDISGSAHWANKCDNGFIVKRNFEAGTENIVEVIIKKIKQGYYGKIGSQPFKFNYLSGTYSDFKDIQQQTTLDKNLF